MKAAQRCRHCNKGITDEGFAPPHWWHLHNSSPYCDLTTAEPMPEGQPNVCDACGTRIVWLPVAREWMHAGSTRCDAYDDMTGGTQ